MILIINIHYEIKIANITIIASYKQIKIMLMLFQFAN